jgi:hypothetical protein
MKYLKLFENHNKNEKIKEILEDHYLYLIDDGYRPSFSHNHDYSITVFNLYKSKIDFDINTKDWMNILQSDTQKVSSIQKRLLNFKIENIISKVQFHVYTYYNYPEINKSTLEPGLIDYSSILNGDINLRDIKSKLTELEMDLEDLEENGMISKPIKWYFDIQILSEIDYGIEDAYSVFFK